MASYFSFQFTEALVSHSEPSLELTEIFCGTEAVVAFHQGNVQVSRKKVLPLVKVTLGGINESGRGTEDVLSPDSGVASLIDTGGGQAARLSTPPEIPDPLGPGGREGVKNTDSSADNQGHEDSGCDTADLLGLNIGGSSYSQTDAGTTSRASDLLGLDGLSDTAVEPTPPHPKVLPADTGITDGGSVVGLNPQPDSVKPGGLLDQDFFEPKSGSSSEAGSVGSLDDYSDDIPEQETPLRSEQEVLDLLSEALEDLSVDAPKPEDIKNRDVEKDAASPDSLPGIVTAAQSQDVEPEEPAETSTTSKIGQEQEQPHDVDQAWLNRYVLDPFADHEGVLMEASPLQGTTPDMGVTPDTSQPTSPPNLSYPGTPPNSLMDQGVENVEQDPGLPSFMNADMVQRIQQKKASLSVIDEADAAGQDDEPSADTFPFTPKNSMADLCQDLLSQQHALPTFDNAQMVKAVQNKRSGFVGFEPQLASDAIKFPYAPPNSFSESSFESIQNSGGRLELTEDDLAQRVIRKTSDIDFKHEEIVNKTENENVTGEDSKLTADEETSLLEAPVLAHQGPEDVTSAKGEYLALAPDRDNSDHRIAQDMSGRGDSTGKKATIWDGKLLRYTGESEVDVAYQLAQHVIQQALENYELSPDTATEGSSGTDGKQNIPTTAPTDAADREGLDRKPATDGDGTGTRIVDGATQDPATDGDGTGTRIVDGATQDPATDGDGADTKIVDNATQDPATDGTVDGAIQDPATDGDGTGTKIVDGATQDHATDGDGADTKIVDNATQDPATDGTVDGAIQDPATDGDGAGTSRSPSSSPAMVETEYLGTVDPLGGQPVKTNSERQVAEGASFTMLLAERKQAEHSTAAPPGGEKTIEKDVAANQPSGGVHFVLSESESSGPQSSMVAENEERRGHSDTQISDISTADSELSQSLQDFLSRMRSDTEFSAMSSDVDELVNAAQSMDRAQQIVDNAISAAVEVVGNQPQEKLDQQGEWDEEELKTRMDQIPEQVAMDTGSASVATKVKDGVDDESRKSPQRPQSLESTPKKRIVPNMDLLKDDQDDSLVATVSVSSNSEADILESIEDMRTPDDLHTPEALNDSVFEGELDWEDKGTHREKGDESDSTPVEPIPEYTAKEEFEDKRNWRSVTVGDKHFRIDMKVIEPYKKVLSHGGYYGDGFNAIIVFAGCYLPDKRRRDYHYVMDNLFLYVLSTLELLVVEDYMVVYFHGATPKHKMPSLRWLKRCYEMIDRRLRKNLKSLLIVHPTIWLKTIVLMTKPFISSKFSSKLKYIRGLKELHEAIPTEYVYIPDEIKIYDAARFRTPPPDPANT